MKKVLNRIITALIALTMVFGLFTVPAQAKAISGNDDLLYWNIWDEGNPYSINFYIYSSNTARKMNDYKKGTSPWDEYKDSIRQVDFSEISHIGAYSFYEFTALEEVNSFWEPESIGDRAFLGCSSLSDLYFPDTLQSIGNYTFYGCKAITDLDLPGSLTSIGKAAFQNCKGLTDIRIPNSISEIKDYTFKGCTNLQYVTIPSSVTSIASTAFDGCSSLEAVITESGSAAETFAKNSGIPYVSVSWDSSTGTLTTAGSGIIPASYGKETLWSGYKDSIKKIVIKKGITGIGDAAFMDCSKAASVSIPGSVKTIGWRAFYGCKALKSVKIPDSVTEVGTYAFQYCTRLASVTIGSGLSTISEGMFRDCGLTSLSVPETVSSIGSEAFLNCSGLTSVSVPASVSSIGEYAFGYTFDETANDGDGEYSLVNGFTMQVYPDSAALTYAENYSVPYKIYGPAKFKVQPKSVKTNAGKTVSFTVKCSNAVSYRWWYWDKVSWKKVPTSFTGYNKKKLTFTAAAEMNGYKFLCKAKGTDGSLTKSSKVKLTINLPAVINAQPKSVSAAKGTKVSFSVNADNAAAYRWQYNDGSGWKNLSSKYKGYNTKKLTLKATKARNGWKFRCKVKGKDKVWIKSKTVKLTVK